MKNWIDSQLGNFTFDEYNWSKTFELNAFSVFTFDDGFRSTGVNNGCVKLKIEADDEEDIPTDEVIRISRLTIDNHESLIREGLLALYNDILGDKVDSGMWWHSEIDEMRKDGADFISGNKGLLTSQDDLTAFLGKPSIYVQNFGYAYGKPCSTIIFNSMIDPEHGIGLLTDGESILGIGYGIEADVFERDDR